MSAADDMAPRAVTVGVVAICGADHLARCLAALAGQVAAPPFEILVAPAPWLSGVAEVAGGVPHARVLVTSGAGSPPELAAAIARAASGATLLLTEDHCEPVPGWVRVLCDAQRPERAAVGGAVDIDPGVSRVSWAFSYSDLFRYTRPLPAGTVAALSVCNVAYRPDRLRAIAPVWERVFVETAVHEALRHCYGPLWMVPEAAVCTRRPVGLGSGMRERASFGRLFGAMRLSTMPPRRATLYALLAPGVPLLLLGRMARKALASAPTGRAFVAGLPALSLFTLAWGWGEWLGYVTRRPPRALVVAAATGR